MLFSESFTVVRENRTTEHTITVVKLETDRYAVKTLTKFLSHNNPRIIGREVANELGNYKTKRAATLLAEDLVSTYQKQQQES